MKKSTNLTTQDNFFLHADDKASMSKRVLLPSQGTTLMDGVSKLEYSVLLDTN